MKIGWIKGLLLVAAVCVCFSCAGAEKQEIKASEIIKLINKGKPVQVADKIILDDLNFTADSEPFLLSAASLQCEVRSNIFFSNCIFMGKVATNGKRKLPVHTCFKNNVVFHACDFRGEVDFSETVIFGMFNFSQSVFRENAAFNNLAVWAKDSYFSEITAEKDFSMISAVFAGNLHSLSAHFIGIASFQQTSFRGKLVFTQSIFDEYAGFDLISVYGGAFFHNAQFKTSADFSSARFLHTADFTNVVFGRKGIFGNAFFLDTADFDGVEPQNLDTDGTFFVRSLLNP
jgi:uncharacterized protein YjbI with pentapeptide repeats